MSWEKDWLRWTHVTYGILQSVRLAEQIDLGNLTKLQENIEFAATWCNSDLGFQTVIAPRTMKSGAIAVKPESAADLLDLIRPAAIQTLFLTTITITEGILCDLLDRVDASRTSGMKPALDSLDSKLKSNGRHDVNGWAIQAMHEARILRNCIAHASGRWSDQGAEEFANQFPNSKIKPVRGHTFIISLDDLFAYRRAAKTVLNEAARLKLVDEDSKGTSSIAKKSTRTTLSKRAPTEVKGADGRSRRKVTSKWKGRNA